MKCKHTQSEKLIYEFEKLEYKEPYDCPICNDAINLEQRLARVLSKFEEDEEEMKFEVLQYISIYYINESKFILWDANTNTSTKKLSLKTVESLLEDLEVE